jgi:3-dehydroquinate synthase
MRSFQSKINYFQKISELRKNVREDFLFIYDKNLQRIPAFKSFIRVSPNSVPVDAGESLKLLKNFEKVLTKVLSLHSKMPTSKITFVGIGGGSVGDFVGFLASTYKRGQALVHIPTTALAAIDSAHGGKTALNCKVENKIIKNQIGSFYPADEVWIVEEFLSSLPEAQMVDGYGEALKIAAIQGGRLWQDFIKESDWNEKMMMRFLPQMIDAKMRIVKKDPFEQLGLRQVLNLGHTLGHVIESQLKVSHGLSVLLGIAFAQEWGLHLGVTKKSFVQIPDHRGALRKLNLAMAKKLLLQDKKRSAKNSVKFIFIEKPGKIISKSVKVQDIIDEIKRQIKNVSI